MILLPALSVQGTVVPFDREKFMAATHGHSTGEMLTTRDWLGRRLHQVARDQTTTTYGELCSDMATAGMLRLEPHSSALAALLGQVNILEHEAGRPADHSGRRAQGRRHVPRCRLLEHGPRCLRRPGRDGGSATPLLGRGVRSVPYVLEGALVDAARPHVARRRRRHRRRARRVATSPERPPKNPGRVTPRCPLGRRAAELRALPPPSA